MGRQPPSARGVIMLGLVGIAAFVVIGSLFLRWEDGPARLSLETDSGPVHVHGLGIDPADKALYIATHTGLFRVAEGHQQADRVGDRFQDTMAFTIVGPNRFLGSGHPDLREASEKDLPPLLGLIESTDSGRSWTPISLLGEADFHVLRFAGNWVYGYDASNERLLASRDRGRTWDELAKPGPLVDLAAAPLRPGRLLATSIGGHEQGLFESRDAGGSWKRIGDAIGLLGWPTVDSLFLVAGRGQVLASRDGGRRLEQRGEIGGEPAAFLAQSEAELYVALHDGTIKRSIDGGATWTVRSAP